MQSKNTAGAVVQRGELPARECSAVGRTLGNCARRRAARRLEIDRDHRLVARALAREVTRVLAEEADGHPELLIERLEAALAVSRADYQRLNDARINLRAARNAYFEDSVPLPAALVAYGHRGNYHGAHASMKALGPLLGPLVGLPDGDAGGTAAALIEALHLRCEIWTIERSGVVHVFARPGSDADHVLARAETRTPRAPTGPFVLWTAV